MSGECGHDLPDTFVRLLWYALCGAKVLLPAQHGAVLQRECFEVKLATGEEVQRQCSRSSLR